MNPQQSAPADTYETGGHRTVLIIVLIVLLIAALIFGGWAFAKMNDYKKNSDQKASVAAAAAAKTARQDQQAIDAEAAKSPTKTFSGSPTYGSVTFQYPKTWSAYVDNTNSSEPINAYFNPGEVPGVQSKTAYALRVELLNSDYSQTVSQLSSSIGEGHLISKAYLPPKLKGVANVTAGVYLSGQVNSQDQTQKGYMVVIKVRDKTLEIYTESADYQNDFNNIVLASLSFAP